MKLTNSALLTLSIAFSAAVPASAAHIWQEPGEWSRGVFTYDREREELYTANELSLDLGGSYTAGQRGIEHLFETSIKGRRGRWGGDVGLNYFFTRELGVGVDINMPDDRGNLIDAISANFIARFPLGKSGVAPYVFGGGGRTTDQIWEWMGQAGLGVEFRLNHTVGIYTDARYQWPETASDSLLFRAGVRLNF